MSVRHAWLVVFLVLVAAPLLAQTSSSETTKTAQLKPDTGTFANNIYKNPYIGFSYTAPGEGWILPPEDAKAKSSELPGQFQLLLVFTQTSPLQLVQLRADDASFYHPPTSLEVWFKSAVRHVASDKRIEIIKDPYPVEYAGQRFYRADYKQNYGGQPFHGSILGTEHSGFKLNWVFLASSEDTLKTLVDSLGTLSFTHSRK